MAKKAQWVIDFCQSIVNDDGTKWGGSWFEFINSGQLLIADIHPEASATTANVQLSPGVLQSCPEGSLRFLKLESNMSLAGGVYSSGAPIALCDEEFLTAAFPGWTTIAAATSIENFMFDENEPTRFKVYPPVHATTPVYVALQHVSEITECTKGDDLLSIADKYAPALAEWCLYLAYSSETDAADPNKATARLQNFFSLLGVKAENRVKYSPNTQQRGGVPPAEVRG